MVASTEKRLEQFMHGLERGNPGEHEFHQAVYEVAAQPHRTNRGRSIRNYRDQIESLIYNE